MGTLRLLSAALFFAAAAGCAATQEGDKCLSDTDCGVGFSCEHKVVDGEFERVGACVVVDIEDEAQPLVGGEGADGESSGDLDGSPAEADAE
jgi:hypothetical protein